MLKQNLEQEFCTRLEARHLLKHPFYQDWMQGRLTREQLQDYACQYYSHVAAFPRYIGAIHSQCESASDRRVLLENLNDEEGMAYGVSHPELWLRFAEGIGVSENQTLASAPRAAIQKVTETFFRHARGSFAQGLGALLAYESQVPEIAGSKIEGLQKNYGISDEKTLQFFAVHQSADVEHRKVLFAMLERLPSEQKQEALQAADEAAQALWDFLTDVHGSSCAAA